MKSNFFIVASGLVVGLAVHAQSWAADVDVEINSSASVVGSGVLANQVEVQPAGTNRVTDVNSATEDSTVNAGDSIIDDQAVVVPAPANGIPATCQDDSCATCGTQCDPWGGCDCGPPNHGIDKAALRLKIGEKKHLHRLKGVTPRAAQYVHWWNVYHARMYPWHGAYYHRSWGSPVALVVPPTSAYQTKWAWGVGNTTVTPIHHQFRRANYGGAGGVVGGPQMQATPHWPSHTDQFGVYYVRGPW